jgi:hypothetical protein
VYSCVANLIKLLLLKCRTLTPSPHCVYFLVRADCLSGLLKERQQKTASKEAQLKTANKEAQQKTASKRVQQKPKKRNRRAQQKTASKEAQQKTASKRTSKRAHQQVSYREWECSSDEGCSSDSSVYDSA